MRTGVSRGKALVDKTFEMIGNSMEYIMEGEQMHQTKDYTQAERDELDRIYNNPPVVDGELVLIDGEVYKTRLIKGGDYSNTAIFDKVEDTKNV